MKHHCTLCFVLMVLVCLSACSKTKQDQATGIEGMWEASANIINSENENLHNDGVIRYCFDSDMSGRLITYANGISHRTDFVYSISECEIQIDFGTEFVWIFPYKLDGDTLMLQQGNNEVIYVRIK